MSAVLFCLMYIGREEDMRGGTDDLLSSCMYSQRQQQQQQRVEPFFQVEDSQACFARTAVSTYGTYSEQMKVGCAPQARQTGPPCKPISPAPSKAVNSNTRYQYRQHNTQYAGLLSCMRILPESTMYVHLLGTLCIALCVSTYKTVVCHGG